MLPQIPTFYHLRKFHLSRKDCFRLFFLFIRPAFLAITAQVIPWLPFFLNLLFSLSVILADCGVYVAKNANIHHGTPPFPLMVYDGTYRDYLHVKIRRVQCVVALISSNCVLAIRTLFKVCRCQADRGALSITQEAMLFF